MDCLDIKNGVAYLHPEDGSSPAYAEGNWAAEYARKLMDAEEYARSNTDGELGNRIDTEAQERKAADESLDGKITNEANRAQAKEEELTEMIEEENTARIAQVGAEAQERKAADGALEFEVCKADNLTDAINAETRIRKEEIGDLAFLIGTQNVTRAINAEYLARDAEDERLQGQIDSEIASRKRAIAEETAAREAADIHNKLKNFADYDVEYLEQGADEYDLYVYTNNTIDNFPYGQYIFSPTLDVGNVVIYTKNGDVIQSYNNNLFAGNTYIIDFQLEGSKLIHTIKAGGLYFFADYDVDYLEQNADEYSLYVYTKNTIDDFPFGKYIFSPALDVGTVVIYTKNGDVIQSYEGKLAAGNTYIIDFQFEGSKLIHTFDAGNGSLEGSGSLSGVPDGSGASELKWQLLNGKDGETLAEGVKDYTYTLPEKCKGIMANISVPKALDLPGTSFNIKEASKSHLQVDQCFIWGKTGATSENKVVRVCCKPENGYYSTTYATNSGSHKHLLTQYWTGSDINKFADTTYLGIFNVGSSAEVTLPAGTIIKIWGLIEG